MKKISSEQVKEVAKIVCKVGSVVYGIMVMVPRLRVITDITEDVQANSGYYDAVRAIMDTGMFASDKQEAISVLKRNGSPQYYTAAISIINSGVFASDKIEMIRSLH